MVFPHLVHFVLQAQGCLLDEIFYQGVLTVQLFEYYLFGTLLGLLTVFLDVVGLRLEGIHDTVIHVPLLLLPLLGLSQL